LLPITLRADGWQENTSLANWRRGGTIAEFEGIPGTSVSYERSEGFNEIISKNKNLRIKTREVAHFDRETARDIMARLLAQGQTFDAVFAHNDSMILGVLDALQQAGLAKWPILVGFDAIPEALQALREGRLSATIAQKPERMGVLAVDLALKALREEPMPAFVPVELDLIETSK
jgi:ribose transport system substrate-binding protein